MKLEVLELRSGWTIRRDDYEIVFIDREQELSEQFLKDLLTRIGCK